MLSPAIEGGEAPPRRVGTGRRATRRTRPARREGPQRTGTADHCARRPGASRHATTRTGTPPARRGRAQRGRSKTTASPRSCLVTPRPETFRSAAPSHGVPAGPRPAQDHRPHPSAAQGGHRGGVGEALDLIAQLRLVRRIEPAAAVRDDGPALRAPEHRRVVADGIAGQVEHGCGHRAGVDGAGRDRPLGHVPEALVRDEQRRDGGRERRAGEAGAPTTGLERGTHRLRDASDGARGEQRDPERDPHDEPARGAQGVPTRRVVVEDEVETPGGARRSEGEDGGADGRGRQQQATPERPHRHHQPECGEQHQQHARRQHHLGRPDQGRAERALPFAPERRRLGRDEPPLPGRGEELREVGAAAGRRHGLDDPEVRPAEGEGDERERRRAGGVGGERAAAAGRGPPPPRQREPQGPERGYPEHGVPERDADGEPHGELPAGDRPAGHHPTGAHPVGAPPLAQRPAAAQAQAGEGQRHAARGEHVDVRDLLQSPRREAEAGAGDHRPGRARPERPGQGVPPCQRHRGGEQRGEVQGLQGPGLPAAQPVQGQVPEDDVAVGEGVGGPEEGVGRVHVARVEGQCVRHPGQLPRDEQRVADVPGHAARQAAQHGQVGERGGGQRPQRHGGGLGHAPRPPQAPLPALHRPGGRRGSGRSGRRGLPGHAGVRVVDPGAHPPVRRRRVYPSFSNTVAYVVPGCSCSA